MRLTTLLDTLDHSGRRPTLVADVLDDRRAFDRVIAGMVPCRSNDPELWFAEQTAQVELAKAMCAECPLIAGCLAGAIDRAEPWGVWGGEVFIDGAVAATKRGRGRPRKVQPTGTAA